MVRVLKEKGVRKKRLFLPTVTLPLFSFLLSNPLGGDLWPLEAGSEGLDREWKGEGDLK